MMYREDGSADHYEPLVEDEANAAAPPCPAPLADWLRGQRRGKKTVAVVGSAFTTGAWAPYGEPGVDVWCANEMHGKSWVKMEGVTAWFQLHPKWSFTKEHRWNHWAWLREEHPFHVYMQRLYDEVPTCRVYPLREVQGKLLGNLWRGEERVERLFTSSFSYMTALAILLGYQRIEHYGIELNLEGEYAHQREAMAYWMGHAGGKGIEVWMPEQCGLLMAPLYAYEEVRKGGTGEILLPPENAE